MINDALLSALTHVKGKDAYLYCEPDILDWTSNKSASLVISGGGVKTTIPFPSSEKDFRYTFVALKSILGGESQILIGWNIKNLFSYLLARSRQFKFIEPGTIEIAFKGKLFDLKVIESFAGIHKDRPTSFDEAFRRLQGVAGFDVWKKFQPYYKNIYLPLISEVLPDIETNYLLDTSKKKKVYSFYELEGQVNGRLKCSGALSNCYLPHNMTDDVKRNLKPASEVGNGLFMYFDYCHMEVSVLQWLSKDEKLKMILDSGKDLYEAIWEEISGIPCNEARRKVIKGIFLPVIYGQGFTSLAKNLGIREDVAKSLVDRLVKTFPTAFQWVKKHKVDIDGFAIDSFGRRRHFEPEHYYKIRNFVIQAPASLICLRRLCILHQDLREIATRIAFHIHDGYGIVATSKTWKEVFGIAVKSLQGEDEMFPGLKLKVSCKAGISLDKMSEIRNA